MDKSTLSDHIYNDTIPQAIKFVESISDEETLFVYAYNYNWNNGFEVPEAILKNSSCTLNVALMLFCASDGFLYLQDKQACTGTQSWLSFVKKLYRQILQNEFSLGAFSFNPQLSKVQEFKLKKAIDDSEMIFITPIEGKDCYVNL